MPSNFRHWVKCSDQLIALLTLRGAACLLLQDESPDHKLISLPKIKLCLLCVTVVVK